MSATRSKVLSLYKRIQREGGKFTEYNFRMYALHRTRDGFRENKNIVESEKIKQLIKEAEDTLQMMQRQVVIGQLYGQGKLIIESSSKQGGFSR